MLKHIKHYALSGAKSYLASYSGLQKTAWIGIVFNFSNAILTGLLPFLSVYFVSTLHLTTSNAGILIAFYGIGTLCGGLMGGQLSDKFSSRIISGLFLLLEAFTYAVIIFTHAPFVLAIDLLIMGFASYGFLTANYTWILAECKNEKSEKFKALGILAMVSNLGCGLASIFIGYSENLGFQFLFVWASSCLAISGIGVLLIKKSTSETIHSSDETETSTSSNEAENRKILFLALICVLLMGSIVAQLNAVYPLYIQENFSNMGLKSISILFTLNSLLIVFFQAPVVHFFKDVNKLRLVGIGSLLLGLGMYILIFSNHYLTMILACIIFTIGEMFFFSSVQLVCYESGTSKKKGQSMGLFRIFYGASRILGPAIGGFIYHFNSTLLWKISAVLGIFCWAICERSKQKTNQFDRN